MINKKTLKKLSIMVSMITLIGGTFIGIMTYINIGFTPEYFSTWIRSLLFAVLIMMPLGGIIMFISNKLVKLIFSNLKEIFQNIILGIFMALCMEAIMAISTSINILGLSNLDSFLDVWLKSYLAALPLALFFSPIMTIFIKPKLDRYLTS